MGTKMNQETYAKLIEEDIAEMEKWMPKYSLKKRHAIEVLRYSINAFYEEDGNLVNLNKSDDSDSEQKFKFCPSCKNQVSRMHYECKCGYHFMPE